MKRLLTSLFATGKNARRPRPASPMARLQVEALEDRQLLSAAPPALLSPAGVPAAPLTAALQQPVIRAADYGGHLFSGTTLARPLSATATSVWFMDTSGLPSQGPFFIRIDQEELLVSGDGLIGGVDGQQGWMAQVTRHMNDTTAVAHAGGAQVDVLDKSTTLPAPSTRTPSGNTPDLRPTFVWSKLDGAEFYDIWVNDRTTNTSQVLRYSRVPPLATSLSFVQWQADRNLIAGHQYEWRVRGISRYNGAGKWSEWATFTDGVAAAPAAPNAPTWAPAGGKTITLSWNNVGADGYVVQYWTGSAWAQVGTTGKGVTSLTVNNGYGHYYRVAAFNGAFNAATTSYSPFTLVPSAVTAPAAPNAPTWAPAGGSTITLSWNNVGADGYVVQYWTGSAWAQVGTTGKGVTSLTVNNGYGHYYRVAAFNGAFNAATTSYSPFTLVPSAVTAPAIPGHFGWAQRYGNNIDLFWDAAAGADGYVVQYWTGSAWAQVGATTTKDVTSMSVTNGYGHYFRVGAKNAAGISYTDWLLAK